MRRSALLWLATVIALPRGSAFGARRVQELSGAQRRLRPATFSVAEPTETSTTAAAVAPRSDMPFELSVVDLATCSAAEAGEIALVFARGFYQRAARASADGTRVSTSMLQPLADDKAEALLTRFRLSPADAAAGADASALLTSVMVVARTRTSRELVGVASIVGCVKVKEMGGASRLLSGREVFSAPEAGSANLTAPKTRRAAMLADVAVVPEARRQGLARALCERCLDTAKAWGVQEALLLVDSNNGAARGLYESMGFVQEGTRSLATEDLLYFEPKAREWRVERTPVTNLLLSKNLRQAGPTKFKLGATTREEETLRKQQIGHVIPVVVLASLVGLGSNLGF